VALAIITVAGFAGYAYYSNQKIASSDGLITPQKMQADYLQWSQSRQRLGDWNTGLTSGEVLPVKKTGFWESWFVLPPDSVARNALLKTLPVGYELKDFKLGGYEKSGENYSLTYNLTLVAKEDQFLTPAQRYNPAAKSKSFLRYSPYLVYSQDLPAGLSYSSEGSRQVFIAGQTIPLAWQVRSLSKIEGGWQLSDAEPLPFTRNPEFESRALAESGGRGTLLLRSGSELSRADQQAVLAVSDLDARIASIESDSAGYRRNLLANLPSRGVDRGGASGSGTPTKAGIGTLAGAGTGALIGGLAGGGDGAAIGAGAGAVAGLFGGYIVGRSDEKRAADRQNYARNSALNQAESQAANYKSSLYRQLEEELKLKADQHNATLRNNFGNLPVPVKTLN
jgi:hypothetical protein